MQEQPEGFEILGLHRNGRFGEITSARRRADGELVKIKTSHGSTVDPAVLDRYSNEFDILRRLDHPGIPVAHELLRARGSVSLVLSNVDGDSLTEWVTKTAPSLAQRLELAIGITDILAAVHRGDILHRNVCSWNVLVDREKHRCYLVDYGSAMRLPLDPDVGAGRPTDDGSIEYMSPESTGRVNRTVDFRSDYYSLGMTLYELFSGRLPHESNDPGEWIYFHIAGQTPELHALAPSVPVAISAIVMKLLSRAPEDRYQSAAGILHDLKRCRELLERDNVIVPFALGAADVTERFELPGALYGRQQQTERLIAIFGRVAGGSREAVLLSGEFRAGKGALAEQLRLPLAEKRGFYATGSCHGRQGDTPFAPVVEALQDLVRQLLMESEESIRSWCDAILAAVGGNGRILIDLVPEFELIIGPQPEVPFLDGESSRNRFHTVLLHLMEVFARRAHPIVLYFDNMHWADDETLELIQLLLAAKGVESLLAIIAFDTSEPSRALSLITTSAEWRDSGIAAASIELGAIDEESACRMIADALRQDVDSIRSLARKVYAKTGGKPYFIRQFLNALHADGRIVFDPLTRRFECDPDAVDRAKISDDVAHHLHARFGEYPPEARRALETGAMIGREFDLATLAAVSGADPDDLEVMLEAPLAVGLIVRVARSRDVASQESATEASPADKVYAFPHDLLRESAADRLGDEEAAALSLAIARVLLARSGGKPIDDCLLRIANHFSRGASLIEDEGEKFKAAELMLRAAARMRESTAFLPATLLYNRVIELLGDPAWVSQPELMIEAHINFAAALSQSHKHELAIEVIDHAMTRAQSTAVRANLHALKATAYLRLGRIDESARCGANAVRALGIDIALSPEGSDANVDLQSDTLRQALRARGYESLLDQPRVTDEDTIAVMALLTACLPAFYQSDLRAYSLVCCKLVQMAIEHGNCLWSARAYSSFAALLTSQEPRPVRDIDGLTALGIQIAHKLETSPVYPAVYFLRAAFASHLVEPIDESIAHYDECLHYGAELGDHQHLAYGIARRIGHLLFRGKPIAELRAEAERALEILEELNESANVLVAQTQLLFIDWFSGARRLTGDTLGASIEAEEEIARNIRATGNRTFESEWNILRLRHRYLNEDLSAACQLGEAPDGLHKYSAAFTTGSEYLFYYTLALAGVYARLVPEEQSRMLARMRSNIAALNECSIECPENRRHMLLLMNAELSRITGEYGEAMHLYDKAVEAARQSRFLHVEALALELAAKFWYSRSKRDFGDIYMRRSVDAYDAMGAHGKADDLRKAYEPQASAPPEPHGAALGEQRRNAYEALDTFDFATVLKASHAISAELVLEQALAKFMDIVLENVGGERIVLVLDSDGELLVQGVKEKSDAEPRLMLGEKLAESDRLATRIAYYVQRTSEYLVLSEPAQRGRFATDGYVRRRQPKSVLCAPIVYQGSVRGIIYIENNQLANAFTPERLEALNILLSQMAISIENASLYARQEAQARRIEQANAALISEVAERATAEAELSRYRASLEELVAQRTRELELANQKLRTEASGREEALAKLAESNEQIRSLAYLDGLTGLPNRRLLNEHLEKVLARSKRKGLEFAVLFVDIDNFKLINDTIGHQAADAVLCDLASSISKLLRSEDVLSLYMDDGLEVDTTISTSLAMESVLSRLGGDEFVVLLTEIRDRFAAGSVAQRIIQRLEQPFEIDDNNVFISASVGIATFPQDGETAQVLLRNADTAMYHAKQQGKSTYQYYSGYMNAASVQRLAVENGLRRALERDEFTLHYQPQIAIGSGQIVGMEALIRWNDPDRGHVPPSEFIPVAESSGLILPIGEWIMREACRQAAAWQQRAVSRVPIAVNVSGVQFRRQDICDLFRQVMDEFDVIPGAIRVEITETSLMSGLDRAAAVLQELREMGVSTALDDFGTGYSSLSYLRAFPLDEIKIDRSFIAHILSDAKTARLTEAIVYMTRILGLNVVAEGVESRGQLDLVAKLGCDVAQGYYFSPAIPADEMESLLAKQPPEWARCGQPMSTKASA